MEREIAAARDVRHAAVLAAVMRTEPEHPHAPDTHVPADTDAAVHEALVRLMLSTLRASSDSAALPISIHVRRVPHPVFAWARTADGTPRLFAALPPPLPMKHTLARVAARALPSALAVLLFQTLYTLEAAFACLGFVHGALTADAVHIVKANAKSKARPWRYERAHSGAGTEYTLGPRQFTVPPALHRGRAVVIDGSDLRAARVWLFERPLAPAAPAVLVTAAPESTRAVDMTLDVRTLGAHLLLHVLDFDALERAAARAPEPAEERTRFLLAAALLGQMAAIDHLLVPMARTFHVRGDVALARILESIDQRFFRTGMVVHQRHRHLPHRLAEWYGAARTLNRLVFHTLDAAARQRVRAVADATLSIVEPAHERLYSHTPAACLNHPLFYVFTERPVLLLAGEEDDAGAAAAPEAFIWAGVVRAPDLLPDPWHMRAEPRIAAVHGLTDVDGAVPRIQSVTAIAAES